MKVLSGVLAIILTLIVLYIGYLAIIEVSYRLTFVFLIGTGLAYYFLGIVKEKHEKKH